MNKFVLGTVALVFIGLFLFKSDILSYPVSPKTIPTEPEPNQNYMIAMGNISFDPLANIPILDKNLTSNYKYSDQAFYIIQFINTPDEITLNNLKANGMQFVQFYQGTTYLVWADGKTIEDLEKQSNVRWTGIYHKAFRIEERLLKKSSSPSKVKATFWNQQYQTASDTLIKSLGATNITTQKLTDMEYSTEFMIDNTAILQILDIPNIISLSMIPEMNLEGN